MWNKKLTCNQLMILLSKYRGNDENEQKLGTYPKDVLLLRSMGFLDEKYWLTKSGEKRVNSALGILYTAEQLKSKKRVGTFDVED